MSGYVWYSFGSDQTGPALGTRLGFDAGKKTPPFENYAVVIGWGCKPGTKYNRSVLNQLIEQGTIRVLNHPDAVQDNRNKLGVLQKLQQAGLSTPGFLSFPPTRPAVTSETLVPDALAKGIVRFPLVGLTEYHKAEPVFCYTLEDVKAVLAGNSRRSPPLCYFRTVDPGNEYRIHVFRDTALFAQRKVLAKDPVEAATQSLRKKLERRIRDYRKEKIATPALPDEATTNWILTELAKDSIGNASQLKKSVSMGWELSECDLGDVPLPAIALAIEALDALGLDIGAVSISYADKTPRVLSVTTAPSLNEEQLGAYAFEIEAFAGSKGKSRKAKKDKPSSAERKRKASPEQRDRLGRLLDDLSEEEFEEVLKKLGV